MLTRLEVNGFKTFEKLDVTLTPFTMVVGNNAAGKSNLFDVIQLLSNLAATARPVQPRQPCFTALPMRSSPTFLRCAKQCGIGGSCSSTRPCCAGRYQQRLLMY